MHASQGLVLITGASGYLGTEVTKAFLDRGFSVRATTRSQEKATQWEIFQGSDYEGKVEWEIVEDISRQGTMEAPVKGVDFIVHIASPFIPTFSDNEKDMIQPTIACVQNVLDAAKKEASVKHLVITSSFGAVMDLMKGPRPGYTYTEEDWNPTTREEAVASPNTGIVYCAAKTFAERVAWDDKERKFSLTTIVPPMIYGPPQQPLTALNPMQLKSSSFIWNILNADEKDEIPTTMSPLAIDVRDVAALHVRAVEQYNEQAKEQRYIAAGFELFNSDVASIVRENPEFASHLKKVRNGGGDAKYGHFLADSKAAEVLLGRPFISADKCITDMARRLWDLEIQLKA